MRMKKIIAAFFLTSALCAMAAGQVKWLETLHEFGAFKEDDGRVTANFRFVNTGDEDVSIRAARASCGCTTPSYPKKPVSPGDTATIAVAYNPIGRPGRFEKSVTVDLAGIGAGPRTKLIVTGVVIGSSNTLRSRYPVEAGPLKLRTAQLPFGTVLKGRSKSTFLEVYNASQSPVKPEWSGVPPYIRVTAADPEGIPPGEQTVYTLSLTPTATDLYGVLIDSAYISVPGPTKQKIDLTAILEEDFTMLTPQQRQKAPVVELESNRLDFGRVNPSNGPVTATTKVKNVGKSPMLVRRIYTTDPGVDVTISSMKIKPGKTATITVTADPQATASREIINGRIQLRVNEAENPIVIVRAVGEIVGE